MKPFRLISLLLGRPTEFINRTSSIFSGRLEPFIRKRPDYPVNEEAAVVSQLSNLLSADLRGILEEPAVRQIELETLENLKALPPNAPFPLFHNGDFRLARICYALVRAMRPPAVVETGVCYGVTSAFILKAMEQNSAGLLHSIDLPPLGRDADDFVGWLIPTQLKQRWHLIRGLSTDFLPKILPELGNIDVFVHDSLHTFRNMRQEFEIVTPYLGRPAAVVSDDIEGNSAFLEWSSRYRPDYCACLQETEKRSLLGIGLFLRELHPANKQGYKRGALQVR